MSDCLDEYSGGNEIIGSPYRIEFQLANTVPGPAPPVVPRVGALYKCAHLAAPVKILAIREREHVSEVDLTQLGRCRGHARRREMPSSIWEEISRGCAAGVDLRTGSINFTNATQNDNKKERQHKAQFFRLFRSIYEFCRPEAAAGAHTAFTIRPEASHVLSS